MSKDYFDDIDYEVDDNNFDDDFDRDDDDDDDDSLDFALSDGVRSKNNVVFDSYEDEIVDEEDYREEPPKKGKKQEVLIDMNSYDERDDLSLSKLKKTSKHRKKNNKVLAIFVIVAVSLAALAILITYSIFQRDPVPSIRSVHIESDNVEDRTVARYGNMITLTFTFNKDLEGLPVVVIRGKEVEVFGEGNSFTAMYFVQEQGMDDELVSFMIKDYMDSFKKTGIPVTATTDGSKVVILKYD